MRRSDVQADHLAGTLPNECCPVVPQRTGVAVAFLGVAKSGHAWSPKEWSSRTAVSKVSDLMLEEQRPPEGEVVLNQVPYLDVSMKVALALCCLSQHAAQFCKVRGFLWHITSGPLKLLTRCRGKKLWVTECHAGLSPIFTFATPNFLSLTKPNIWDRSGTPLALPSRSWLPLADYISRKTQAPCYLRNTRGLP